MIRHIGPIVQDFYATFVYGKNKTTITTIDADDVVLAAIQVLYQLVEKERERNHVLEEKVNLLIQEIKQLKK